MKLLVTALILTSFTSAFAAKNTAPKYNYFEAINKIAPGDKVEAEWFTPEEDKAAMAEVAKAQREPSGKRQADLVADESHMSKEFQGYRDEFLKVKTAEDLNNFLVKLDTSYDTLKEDDTRFFAAQAIAMRTLRGIVWKMVKVFDSSDKKMIHSVLITFVRSVAGQMKVLLPTDQWEAGFAYITQPYIEDRDLGSMGNLAARFYNETDLFGYFAGPVYDALGVMGKRIAAIKLANKNIVWDNQLLYGKASFQDGIDRYRLVGEIERLNTLSGIDATMAAIAYNRAYSWKGLVSLYGELGKLYGIDAYIKDVDGVPASKRAAVYRQSEFSEYGRRLSDGVTWTHKALAHLRRSLKFSSDGWDLTKVRQPNKAYLFDTSFAATNEHANDLRVANIRAAATSITELRSAITGETVVFDLPNFFNFPPEDLKAFLPTGFEEGETKTVVTLKEKSGKVVTPDYRNYFLGRATAWNVDAYKLVFPKAKNSKDIERSTRILNQSMGSSVFSIPLLNILE